MSLIRYMFVFITVIVFVHSHTDDVHTIQYDVATFAEEVPKKNHFVMFYAPWCGHCQKLASTWEQLAEMLNEEDGNIRIAKVDCTVDSKICSEQDVTGYPTLKFFKLGSPESIKFRGTRDLPSLSSFINDQLRSIDRETEPITTVPEYHKGLIELTDKTFDQHVANGKHFIKFYAPWCGHCQKLAPVWEQLAELLEFEPEISIAKVDCTQFRSICNQFEIKGYPTILWIENGKKVEKYQGARTHDDLKSYVNIMLGSTKVTLEEKKQEPVVGSPVFVLTGDNFHLGTEKGTSIVKFFAPWCGHCKRLAPTWEELAKKFSENQEINVIKVDCTLETNKQLCSDQEVDGFPSIFLYRNGKKMSEYTGSRSLEDLQGFVLNHVGSHDEL